MASCWFQNDRAHRQVAIRRTLNGYDKSVDDDGGGVVVDDDDDDDDDDVDVDGDDDDDYVDDKIKEI